MRLTLCAGVVLAGILGGCASDGPGAFVARVALVNAAVSSIDVQYYIWHDATTGELMFSALLQAARRGVRVRLLLDDLTTRGGLDSTLAALGSHPKVEAQRGVRIRVLTNGAESCDADAACAAYRT